MFTKKLSMVFFAVILVLVFSMISLAQNPIVIKLSHGDTADGSWGTCDNGAVTFKRLVESRSDGRIKVEIYPNCQLGSEREMEESVMMGTTQATWCSTPDYAGWIPEIGILNIPYLFDTAVVAFKVMDGDFGREFNEFMIEKTGIRFLGYGHIGFRNFTNNVRPIRTPADMVGLKIRTQENPVAMQMVKALGASPTPIAWGELYTSLQQGVVDGEENPTSMIQVAKLYEVQKYLTMDGHTFGINPLAINEKFYQSLPDDLKYIVADSGRIACIAYRGLLEYGNGLDIDDLTQKGMEIYFPTPDEIALFKEATQEPVIEWLAGQIGREWIDKLLNAIEEAKAEYYLEIE
ncbi:MAG: DctP family TRAP transporter solute-binding subunit [Atribacterota bacterium]|nr:DctP family TRAP transporter solute-binding subunit [Atribacterota bacterium]